MNEFLAVAPEAAPLCGRIAAMVSVDDVAERKARALADGESLGLGHHEVRWLDAPHVVLKDAGALKSAAPASSWGRR